MTAKSIGCPAGCDDIEFGTSDELDEHLARIHDTTYDRAVGNVLTQDECDLLGLDGRDGTGEYRLSDLSRSQRFRLWDYRATLR